jgi:hypothetical protein
VVFGAEQVEASDEVPPLEHDQESFLASLGPRWYVLLHANNERSLAFAEIVRKKVGEGRWLVLYVGGDDTSFREFGAFQSFRGAPFVECVCSVGEWWIQPLKEALGGTGAPLQGGTEREQLGEAETQLRAKTTPIRTRAAVPQSIQEFEDMRAHVSHDLFTNAFCVPLGFHCTEVDSPRRRDLLVWARSNERWWKNLRGPASRWSETRRAVEGVLQRAEILGGDAPTTAALREVLGGARLAMGKIDRLMEKFAGSVFEDAGLTDMEIELFWTATDTIRRALQAVRVTEQGLDPAFFIEILTFLRDEPASRGEG